VWLKKEGLIFSVLTNAFSRSDLSAGLKLSISQIVEAD
jgi:hypothetical protein